MSTTISVSEKNKEVAETRRNMLKQITIFQCNMDLNWVAPTMRKFVPRLGYKLVAP